MALTRQLLQTPFKRQEKKDRRGTPLAVQWLSLCASSARNMGSIPGLGTKIPNPAHLSQKKRMRKKKDRGTHDMREDFKEI